MTNFEPGFPSFNMYPDMPPIPADARMQRLGAAASSSAIEEMLNAAHDAAVAEGFKELEDIIAPNDTGMPYDVVAARYRIATGWTDTMPDIQAESE